MRIPVRASLCLIACCTSAVALETAAAGLHAAPLDDTAWVVTTIAGRRVPAGSTVTLQFADGRLTGSDGCNRFAGGYSTAGSAFEVSPQLASTRMACPDDIQLASRVFISVLAQTRSYRVNGARLLLLSADGATLVALAAQSLLIEGTSWTATAINNGRQGVQSVVHGTTVTLSFGADGDASGSSGCNHYSGRWEASGSGISIRGIAVTEIHCAAPEGVMEQEQAYLAALAAATSASLEGNRLELRAADRELVASFTRAAGG